MVHSNLIVGAMHYSSCGPSQSRLGQACRETDPPYRIPDARLESQARRAIHEQPECAGREMVLPQLGRNDPDRFA